MADNVLGVLWITYTILGFIIFHKLFYTIYFGGIVKGIMNELFWCGMIAALLALATLYFWKYTLIAIIVIGILCCPTAHCERYKPHFDFGDIPSPIVPHRNKLQTQGGMTAH